MILYHGTTVEVAKKIKAQGFRTDLKYNWDIHTKQGFVSLSLAYAPFYAMMAKSNSKDRAIVKVSVDKRSLYPEDDFLMLALGHPVYTQAQIDKVNFENYKQYYIESLKYMGNANAKPDKIKVLGTRIFDVRNLLLVCDPSITPTNYKFLGAYYKKLTEWIYDGNNPLELSMNRHCGSS